MNANEADKNVLVQKNNYKNTVFGLLPKEWEIVKLKDVSIGKGTYGIGAAAVDYNENLPRYLRITDIDDQSRIINDHPKCVDNPDSAKYILQENDLVFARTGNTTGKSYLYKKEDGVLVYAGFLIKFSINPLKADSRYVKLFTETNYYWQWVGIMSKRSGQPGINENEYAKLPLPLPPLKEQQKIASILYNWDKAIELKEKLIEQKKEQKKGLMQKLLTGEVRLPGFDGDWKHIKLGKFVKLQGGFAFKSSEFKQEGIPIIRISNIVPEITDTNQEFVYYDEIDGLSESFKVNFGDILIAMSGATTGKVGLYKKNEFAYLNQRVGKFVNLDGSKLDYSFLYYLVKSSMFKLQLKEELATGAQPNISSKQIERFNFKIPPLDEQKGISNILNQIDKSIFLLEKEVDLLTQQKKGLMQLLLTGKIRVQV